MKNWYNVSYIKETDCYIFETDNKVVYEIRLQKRPELVSGYPHIELNVAEFSFAPVNAKNQPADIKIEATIAYFLSLYFFKQTNALVIVYESLDGRHEARHLLFNKWFTRNALESFIEKINFAIHMDEGLDVKGLFMFRTDHPQHDEVMEMVNTIIKDMQSYK